VLVGSSVVVCGTSDEVLESNIIASPDPDSDMSNPLALLPIRKT
jgi:hypothetical protein